MLRLVRLLVLGITLGLLGMHALDPTAALTSEATTEHASHDVAAAHIGAEYLCPDADHGTDRPGAHTDQMCASPALPASPGIAAPDTAPVTVLPVHVADAPATRLHAVVAYEPARGRAPPSRAELQLLRR